MGLFRVWPSFLLLDGRTSVGVGAVVRVYSLWRWSFVFGVVSVVLGIQHGGVGGGGVIMLAVVVASW